jgi:hypothetical protein
MLLVLGTDHVHMDFLCIYRVHELTNFTNNSEKIMHVHFIVLHQCIKFQIPIPSDEGAVIKKQILTDLNS